VEVFTEIGEHIRNDSDLNRVFMVTVLPDASATFLRTRHT
jgi:hypothetical protein